MAANPPFDLAQAHRYFSADCFNKTWELIEKESRTPEENEQMLLRCQASLWHWTQRPDCKPQNLSVGYWQMSRVLAIRGDIVAAAEAGMKSLKYAENEPPFYRGYAYEACARAAWILVDRDQRHRANFEKLIEKARACAAEVTDAEDRAVLEKDLESISLS